MDLLILVDLASGYDEWKAVFDADADAQAELISGGVLVGQADDKTAMIVGFDVNMEGLAAFMGSPEFAARTAPVVAGHRVFSLTELPPPS